MPLVLVAKSRMRRPLIKAKGELLAESFEPKMQRAFRTNIAGVLTDAQVRRLARAVADQDMTTAMEIVPPYGDDAWDDMESDFADNYQAIIEAAGQQGVDEANLGFTFDIDQTHAIKWIDKKSAALVKDISRDTRNSIRDVIRRGSTEGLTVDQQAKILRPMIGLTDNQSASVWNRYESMRDAGMGTGRAASEMADYANELLTQRAETIARTETAYAQNYGKLASWNQAGDQGLLGPNPTKTWVGSAFESSAHGACEACASLDGTTVALDEMFEAEDYDPVAVPPLHPRCRCTASLSTGFEDDDR